MEATAAPSCWRSPAAPFPQPRSGEPGPARCGWCPGERCADEPASSRPATDSFGWFDFGKHRQRFAVENRYVAVTDRENAGSAPLHKEFVGAFPGNADQAADLLLRQPDIEAQAASLRSAEGVGEAQQPPRG